MGRKLLAGVGMFGVLFVVVGLMLPSAVRLERAIVIETPPANAYSLVANLKLFNDWAPWFERDPSTHYEYSGPKRGVGARMTWAGQEDDVGSGSQVITDARPFEMVRTHLTFDGAREGDAVFTIEGVENGCRVTWSFETDFGMSLLDRYLGLIIGSSVGADYERGLVRLKEIAEKLPKTDIASLDIGIETVAALDVLYIPLESELVSADINSNIGAAVEILTSFVTEHEIEVAGATLVIGRPADLPLHAFDVGIPVVGLPADFTSGEIIHQGRTFEGPVLLAIHTGSYDYLPDTYDQIDAYMALNGFALAGDPWEEYVSDPELVAEEDLITWIYTPIGD